MSISFWRAFFQFFPTRPTYMKTTVTFRDRVNDKINQRGDWISNSLLRKNNHNNVTAVWIGCAPPFWHLPLLRAHCVHGDAMGIQASQLITAVLLSLSEVERRSKADSQTCICFPESLFWSGVRESNVKMLTERFWHRQKLGFASCQLHNWTSNFKFQRPIPLRRYVILQMSWMTHRIMWTTSA